MRELILNQPKLALTVTLPLPLCASPLPSISRARSPEQGGVRPREAGEFRGWKKSGSEAVKKRGGERLGWQDEY